MYQTGVRRSARSGAGRKALITVIATGACLGASLGAVTTPANAEDGNLPGGTSISVDIVTPADNSTHLPGTVSLGGTAEVGTTTVIADTGLITVLDNSGSTSASGGSSGCGNPNTTDPAQSILDCEITSAVNVNQAALSLGTVGSVGAIAFNTSAATADANPAAGTQQVTTPSANNDGDPGTDIEAVFRSITQTAIGKYTSVPTPGGLTNYTAALQQVTALSGQMTEPTKVAIFMSDGAANQGGPIAPALATIPADTTIHTFAIGSSATCTLNSNGLGTLQDIANATGGTCTKIVNANNLPSLVPGVISGQLLNLNVSIDGGTPTPITNATIAPDLPVTGPATVSYTVDVTLTGGTHELCVSAGGSDAGGPGSVIECIDVLVQSPPGVDAGGPYAGVEGSPITLAGSATDPDNDPLTTLWSVSSIVGGPCALADAASLDATLTCDDDAVVDLTLSADDGAGPPITDNATATVDNADPVVSLGDSSAGLNENKTYTAPFTDAGSGDTHTCSFAWGDASPATAGVVAGGNCTGSHAYASSGDHSVTVNVTDDDGGVGTATAVVSVNSPPAVDAGGPYTGSEGSSIPLTGTATDADGDSLTYSWTVADPRCTLTGGPTLTQSVTCTDNLVTTLEFTADDGPNPSTGTASLTVTNVDPTVDLTGPAAAALNQNVTFTATISDPGSADTHTCSFAWGDATPISPAVVAAGVCSATHSYATPGSHTVTVTVTDDDNGVGTDTATVVVNAPPAVDAGGPYAGNEGSAIPLSGTVTDLDGDPVTHSWAISGVTAGATCSLAGGGSLTPTVMCDDNAVVTVTLTGDDGVNAPVTDTATVMVSNVNPTVILTAPGSTVQGTTVTFTAAVSDAGAGDTHTCTFQWGDTSPNTTVNAVGGVCTASHTMTTTGPRTVKVIATDDDGGTGSDTVTYMVAYGASAWVLEVSGGVNPGKQGKVFCPPLSATQGLGTLNIGVVVARTLSSACQIFPAAGTTVATSRVEKLDVLSGAIKLTAVEATCTGGPGGITRTSTVGTLNGVGIGSAPSTIDLGVAVVHLNENTVVGGKLTRHAVRIEIRPVVLLGLVVVPSTSVTAAGCTIG
jgi:hypothetical protein